MSHHRCGSSSLCLHDLASVKESDDNDFEYVEVDPTGRYGRYKEVLGKGAFKTVYRAFDQEDGIEVAWNQVQVQDVLQTSEDLDRLYSEVHLLKTLKHKNIMKFYNSWVDRKGNNINFITEIFTSGTLRQYRQRHKHVDIKAVKNWSRQILRGLLYLHSHDPPIIHRDLKCDNILINGNQGEVKIGDLGLATILQHAHAARSVIGTPEFMAPELYEEEYTELVDIYSFGMCLLEMVTFDYPYSECSNAAQIYKKVMSGKKPEALKKVKDPELCQFIEKCLATASKRLPARELLMDTFLQYETIGESSEPLPPIGRMIQEANDIDDLAVFMEECHGKSATVQISYKLKETIPSFPEDSGDSCIPSVGDLKSGLTVDYISALNLHKPIPTFHSKEEHARSVDFRVNGKKGEDGTVFLKFRLADPEGQVRNIHFPFDVEGDTAMCVASEMVAELDLTDQDVTKIAEMIDAAILALVPEWKPGVAIDETGGDGEVFVSNVGEDGHSSVVDVFDPLTSILSEDPLEDKSPSFLRVLNPDAGSPSKLEGLMHRRFEEVSYQCNVSEFPAGVAEDHCTVSSDSFDPLKGGDWCSTDGSSCRVSQTSNASLPNAPISPLFEECSRRTDVRITNSMEEAAAFNELVESERKDGCSHYTHVTWEGILQWYPNLDYCARSALASLLQKLQEETCQQDAGCQDSEQFLSASPSLKTLWDWDSACNDESAAQELTELALIHEKELRDLQRKHEEAISELRNRWQQKRDTRLSSASDVDHEHMHSHNLNHNMQVQTYKDTDGLENGPLNFRAHEILCGVSTNVRNFGSASRMLTDKSSSQVIRVSLPYDTGPLNGLMERCDHLSSHGQATPKSNLKPSGWRESAFTLNPVVNVSLTDETLYSSTIGEDGGCKCLILRTQNPIESELGTLCIPIKAQAVGQMV